MNDFISWLKETFFGPSLQDVIIERVKARGHITVTVHSDGTVTSVDNRHPNWKQMMIDDEAVYKELK